MASKELQYVLKRCEPC